jgi:hypothetical protein
MKISGFTFVRNARRFGFPLVESVRSLLPLVDEFIVNIGLPDEDGTERHLLGSLTAAERKKIRVIRTTWDPRWTDKMRIFAAQTNIAMYACTGDWLFYIQADEVVHEKDYNPIRSALRLAEKDPRVEGLLFRYIHFWGGSEHFLDSPAHYQREVRIIRNFKGITSWRDAQGFRLDGRKLRVADCRASIYHYGYAVTPRQAVDKSRQNSILYRGREATNRRGTPPAERFYLGVNPYFLSRFRGTHPAVMRKFLTGLPSGFDPKKCRSRPSFKQFRRNIQTFLFRAFGFRAGEYRNYTLLR